MAGWSNSGSTTEPRRRASPYSAIPMDYSGLFAPTGGSGGGGGRKPPGDPWGDAWNSGFGGTGAQTDENGNPVSTKTPTANPYDPNTGTFGNPDQWWTTTPGPTAGGGPSWPNGPGEVGYDEDWYRKHAGDYDVNSSAEDYWAGVNGKFAAGPERSTGAQKGYDTWFDTLSEPGFTAAGAAQPHGSHFGEEAYGGRDTGPSRSETYADAGGPTFSNYGANAYGNGANRTTFAAGDVFSRFFDPLSQESNSEKLYGQDPGLGAYYDRAYETGSEKLSNAMAAKGLFQSGAAADEERNLIADLGADRAKNEADYRLRAAGQSDSERRGRMGLAGQMGSAADSSSLARSQNERAWSGMLDDTELGQAQERRAGREFADTFGANRDIRNMNWADMLDKNTLARSAEDRAWGTAADADRVSRSGEARQWSDLLGDEVRDNNKDDLDWLKAGGDLAAGADAGKYGRKADQRAAAAGAQGSAMKRYEDQYNRIMDLAKTQSNLVTGAVDAASKEKFDATMARIKASLAKAKAGQQLSQQEETDLMSDLATAKELYEMASGKPPAGGSTPGGTSYGSAITDI